MEIKIQSYRTQLVGNQYAIHRPMQFMKFSFYV